MATARTSSSIRLRRIAGVVATGTVAGALVLSAGTPASAADGDYGRNDAGGFRNVLPPGQNGLDNAADLAAFFGKGTLPAHWADQQPLYQNLLYASPTLTDAQIPTYFKDATFGVKAGDVESRTTPRSGVTILRDKDYGVPHIYGTTRRNTMYGAGYAGAQDRLFLMDVLRHTGRADLASFLGGGNVASDADQWRFAAYSDKDYQRQFQLMKQLNGRAGRQAVSDVRAYVKGINAYIGQARTDSAKLPSEYALIKQPLKDWQPSDVLATASLIGGIFGRGGGREVDSALVLNTLRKRFGTKLGNQIWWGFRSKNDPETPTTLPDSFPYQQTSPFAKRGLALPKGTVQPAQIQSPAGVSAQSAPPSGGSDIGAQLHQAFQKSHASNWELVAARNSRNGHPLAVMGPQVGYYLPQILMEEDLHGPGIDARGVSFAGVNLIVQMGHGRDYAWSATSAGSDNVDTFAEVLCGGDRHHYRYKGKCKAMQKLTRKESWQPNVIDSTPAGSTTLTIYRTVHGLVQSYGRAAGKRVAFATARTSYFHEAESVLGFSKLNDPGFVHSPATFQKAAQSINFVFNWAYTDAKHTSYYLSGAYPDRAQGTSPDFPILGTGAYDWQGFKPKTWTERLISPDAHPHVTDQGVQVSWNNKPAKAWSAADDQWDYSSYYRSQLIADKIRADLKGGRKMRLSQLVQAMEESATQDIRTVKLLPVLIRAIGTPSAPQLKSALQDLKAWRSDGAHRRDMNKDGVYEHNRAVQIMDAWWPLLVKAEFQPRLGKTGFESVQTMIGLGAVKSSNPRAPAFSDGWWGYVSKDLRSLFTPAKVKGAYARIFCGNGSKSRCRTALQDSLASALTVTPAQLYGFGACEQDPQASCYDQNRPRITAAINKPGAFPFQNRPTFQQTVTVPRMLRRPSQGNHSGRGPGNG